MNRIVTVLKSTNVLIHPINKADRDKLREIYLLCRIQAFHWMDSNLFTLNDFDAHTHDEDIWVATFDNEIVGFIAVWPPDAFVHHLYVHIALQRKRHRKSPVGFGCSKLSLSA
ncbi:GNAT family N-acetyltransferase [Mucilaginibacter sp. NFR10]|uniref:GNAT family N-acetyltransferase n=1 Tax=Mucilaginibacter sp. NFR10 TaxID=1566292 RepID=UPI00087120AA|nr:hypothetical protein SAMN03159284_02995 [Mucilaginibacter sp. NFR10]